MKNVYTVAQVNSYIKNMFSQDFMLQNIYVKGEVSNCKYHSSGHIYFTIKDAKGTIACVMFAGNRAGLKFRMEEGQQVVVGGSVEVYERDGKYQLYAREIILDGAGYLYEKFERLKRELLEQGLFASEYKQPLPKYIRTLGGGNRTYRGSCAGYYKYHAAQESLCTDYIIPGYCTGRAGGGQYHTRNPGSGAYRSGRDDSGARRRIH